MTQLGTGANDAYPISIPIADLIAFCSVPATKAAPAKAAPGKAAAKVKSVSHCKDGMSSVSIYILSARNKLLSSTNQHSPFPRSLLRAKTTVMMMMMTATMTAMRR